MEETKPFLLLHWKTSALFADLFLLPSRNIPSTYIYWRSWWTVNPPSSSSCCRTLIGLLAWLSMIGQPSVVWRLPLRSSVIEGVFKLREAQLSAIVDEMRKSLIGSYVWDSSSPIFGAFRSLYFSAFFLFDFLLKIFFSQIYASILMFGNGWMNVLSHKLTNFIEMF